MNAYNHNLNQIKMLDLNDYIYQTREHVKQISHIDNSPFFLQGDPNKPLIILIHGFSSSAYAMRSLAYQLNEQGYNCFAPLLLGHGTSAKELNKIRHTQWLEQLSHFIEQAKSQYSDIHLIGHSYGGLLATLYTLKNPQNIKSLMLFAPAFALTAPWVSSLPPYLSPLSKLIPVKPLTHVKSLCGFDRFSYHEFPMQAAAEIVKHIKTAKEELKKPIKKPIFMVLSTEDETISSDYAIDYFENQTNPRNYCMVYSALDNFNHSHHQINVINSRDLSPQVVDFSHLGMHIDINDPHYGIEGHYYQNTKPYPIIFGAMSTKNKIKIKNLKRLAFNPDFYQLNQKLLKFLESV